MKILAIETSCDDTCVSIVKVKDQKSKTELPFMEAKVKKRTSSSSPFKSFDILSNVVSSQVKLHAKYGGVYPTLAKREHQRNLPTVFKKALKKIGSPKIDFIAVTVGPGLEPCLWTGINFAKELAKNMKTPIIPVNHIEAHIAANFIGGNHKSEILNPKFFPAVCLVVSGGHTQLILMKGVGKYQIVGETQDDAAGECFDKTARILGLGYPGGPIISTLAKKYKGKKYTGKYTGPTRVSLPRPMIYQKNYDFSFSGLKTAVLYDFKKRSPKTRKSKQYIQQMCAEIQQAIIDVLIHKTLKAAKDYKARSIILGGGVAANKELKKQFEERIKKEILYSKFYIPDSKFCTDNAAMVAVAGYFNTKLPKEAKVRKRMKFSFDRQKKKSWKKIEANANLKIGEKL